MNNNNNNSLFTASSRSDRTHRKGAVMALRKVLLAPALAAMLLFAGACSDEKLPSDYFVDPNLISLGVNPDLWISNPATRASSTTLATMQSIGVMGYNTLDDFMTAGETSFPNLMFNVEAKNPGTPDGVWMYNSLLKWPDQGKCSFFAYSPYAAANGENGIEFVKIDDASGEYTPTYNPTEYLGVPMIRFEVNSDPAKQVDLLCSDVLQALDKVKDDGRINFTMRHVLTRIAFNARKSEGLTGEIKIIRIVLRNVCKKAVLTLGSMAPTDDTSGDLIHTYYSKSRADFTVEPTGGPVNITGTPNTYTPITDTGQDAANYLMLLPQKLAPDDVNTSMPEDEKIYLRVEYNQGNSTDVLVRELDLSTLVGHNWQGGKAITYNITVGLSQLDVEALVSPWENTEVNGNIPGNYLKVYSQEHTLSDFSALRIYYASDGDVSMATDATDPEGNSVLTHELFRITKGETPGGQKFFEVSPRKLPVTSHNLFLRTTHAAEPNRYIERMVSITAKPTNADVPVAWKETPWVGTFHRASEVGERIIYAGHTGEWTATVDDPTGTGNFVVLDAQALASDLNLKTNSPGDPEQYPVKGNQKEISGTGNIFFRVGMASKLSNYKPDEMTHPRYATITLKWKDGATDKTSTLYVRQGEAADYLFRPTDPYDVNNATNRNLAVKISPYNLTAKELKNETVTSTPNYNSLPVSLNGGVFTEYPSQVGAVFFWQHMYAFHFTNPESLTGSNPGNPTNHWNVANELCPHGYRRPSESGGNGASSNAIFATSEIKQSLFCKAVDGYSRIESNFTSGYYADGFFDRRKIEISGFAHMVNSSQNSMAYQGELLYNNKASLFIPRTGYRQPTSGSAPIPGLEGAFWTTTTGLTSSKAYRLTFRKASFSSGDIDKNHGMSIRCVALPGYQISFDKNTAYGGMSAGDAPASIETAASFSLPGWPVGSAVPQGKKLGGWNTKADGSGTLYAVGATYTPTTQLTLYACWVLDAVGPVAPPNGTGGFNPWE